MKNFVLFEDIKKMFQIFHYEMLDEENIPSWDFSFVLEPSRETKILIRFLATNSEILPELIIRELLIISLAIRVVTNDKDYSRSRSVLEHPNTYPADENFCTYLALRYLISGTAYYKIR